MAVAGVEGGAQIVQGQGHLARPVGAVDEGLDAALAQGADQVLERQDQAGLADDMVDHQQARGVGDGGEHALDDLARVRQREGDRNDPHAGADAPAVEAHGVGGGVVLGVQDQDLVAGTDLGLGDLARVVTPGRGLAGQHRQGRVHSGGRVGHEDQAPGVRAEEPPQEVPRMVDARLELAVHEGHRAGLEPQLQLALRVHHDARRGAEGAVVQVVEVRIQVPVRNVRGHGVRLPPESRERRPGVAREERKEPRLGEPRQGSRVSLPVRGRGRGD